MGIINIFYIVTRRYQRSKMKLYMLIAVAALLFVGYVRAEEEEIDVTDLAEEDFSQIKKGRHRVNHLVYLAVKYRHQYRVCHHRYPKIVKHCHRRLHHFKRVYHHLKHRVHRARRVLRSWLHKYRHCVKFCWWRRGGKHKGDVKEDIFGLGRLIHHVGHGILGIGHHAVNLVAGVLGDTKLDAQDKDALIASINKVLADDKLTTEQKEDFLGHIIRVIGHGALHVVGHAVNFVSHIVGDNKLDAQDKIALLASVNKVLADDKLTTEQKEDFLGHIIRAVGHGILGIAHHAVNFVAHVVGDNKLDAQDKIALFASINKVLADDKLSTEQKEDFLGHIIRAVGHGVLGIAHHAVNFVSGILGDNKLDANNYKDFIAALNKKMQ